MTEDMRKPKDIGLDSQVPKTSVERVITPELSLQIDGFVDRLQAYNRTLPEYSRRGEENYLFLRDFYKRVIEQRNARSYEAESEEYKAAEELAESQFPVDPYLVLCMDGRVLPPLVFGMTYGIGGSIRVPGGILQEFDRGRDGDYFLRTRSVYEERIESALVKSDMVAQVFDSHVACAARNAEEESRGAHLEDSGLLRDVLFKREIAQATRKHFKDKFGEKKIMTIQTSFDPHNGYLFMGLETDEAIKFARVNAKPGEEPEFTGSVRHELAEQGKIISTEHLAGELSGVFENYGSFQMDWKRQFVDTSSSFWSAISKMKDEARAAIQEKIIAVYPRLKSKDKFSKMELEERTILLLANAFSGYMLNKSDSKEHLDAHEETQSNGNGRSYEYGDHHEEFIKVYEGGQPPYETSAFVLFSLDEKNLPPNIELAAKLVRKNRAEGRAVDSSGNFTDAKSFEKAVVPIVVHEIVREQLSDKQWEDLSKIDWSDLPENWDTLTDDEFRSHLLKKGISHYPVMENLNNLRRRMAVLYDPAVPLSSHLTDQFKVALPTVIGKNRRNYFVVPFVKLGYEDSSPAA